MSCLSCKGRQKSRPPKKSRGIRPSTGNKTTDSDLCWRPRPQGIRPWTATPKLRRPKKIESDLAAKRPYFALFVLFWPKRCTASLRHPKRCTASLLPCKRYTASLLHRYCTGVQCKPVQYCTGVQVKLGTIFDLARALLHCKHRANYHVLG